MTTFDAHPISIPDQQSYDDSVFPYVFQSMTEGASLTDVVAWVGESKDELLQLATRHGAVLFRGFPLATAPDFDALVAALEVENFPYRKSLSNAVRVNFTERVFSANEAPSNVQIFLHHEMAQTPLFPSFIAFFCEIPAESGGATPICRSDTLHQRLLEVCPGFIEKLATHGLKYSNVMPGVDDPESGMGRSWQSTLGVSTKEAAEERLRKLGYSWQWLPESCLRATTPVLPAVREVSPGRFTLFNQLIAAYSGWKDERNDPSSAIRLGNDEPLDPTGVSQLIELAAELSYDMAWQAGDAVLMDNTVAMHGRNPFEGRRKVLASLGNMQTHSFASSG